MVTDTYRLSSSLLGHTEDIKALSFDGSEIYSVSRDSQLRKWSRSDSNSWIGETLYKGAKYLNALTVNSADHAAIIGGQDSQILVVDTDSGIGTRSEPRLFLLGHESNVCALDVDASNGLIASGSWDKTSRIWNHGQVSAVMKHNAAVWGVLFWNGSVVTACADQVIRIWSKTGDLQHTLRGHTDAVRGLAKISDESFASCSNDGTIRIWRNNSAEKVLTGHTSFVYSLDYIQSKNMLVSSGEDRSVRVWDLNQEGKCVQVITLPAISLWSVKADQKSGDIVVGGSDCIIRVFTTDLSRQASAEEIKSLEESIANSSIGKDQVGEIKEDQLSDASVLQKPGDKEGAVVMVKSPIGTIEAHQWSGGNWFKIGEVVGNSSAGGGGSSNRTAQHNGKLYDYVFDVDIEDGKPPLKLPYNNTDNPYRIADKFLADNDLPTSYREDVVRFILTNAQPVEIGSSAPAPSAHPTVPKVAEPPAPKNLKIIPQPSYVQLVSYKAAPILKQVESVNAEQTQKLSDLQKQMLKDGLEDGITESNAPDILKIVIFMTQNWPPGQIFVALDILRIVIPKLNPMPTAVILQQLFYVLDADAPKHALLAIRGLVNMFASETGRKLAVSEQVRSHVLDVIKEFTNQPVGTLTPNLQIAIASLLLNYSVFVKNDSDQALGLLSIVSSCTSFSSFEAIYRLLLGVGTVLANCPTEDIKQAYSAFDLNNLTTKAGSIDEKRFSDLVGEIKQVL